MSPHEGDVVHLSLPDHHVVTRCVPHVAAPGIQPAVGDIASASFSKADYITSYAVFHIWGLGGCCPLTHNHGGCHICSPSLLLPCNGYPLHKAYYSMSQDYDMEALRDSSLLLSITMCALRGYTPIEDK